MGPDRARSLLGVSAHADAAAIRRRYHLLARDLHPDAGGDVDEFHELQQAYAVLVDVDPTTLATRPRGEPDRAAAHRAELDRLRAERERLPAVDPTSVDWDRPLPERPRRLDRDLLAVAAATGATTAVSRGPRSALNALAPTLDDALTARLEVVLARDDGQGVQRLTATGRRGRRLLDHLRGGHGWHVVRHSSDQVVATRVLPPAGDRRVDALRHVHVATEALDRLGWPLGAWLLTEPLRR